VPGRCRPGSSRSSSFEGIYANGGPGTVAVVKARQPAGDQPEGADPGREARHACRGVWPAVLQSIPAHYTVTPYMPKTYDSVQPPATPDGSSITIDQDCGCGEGAGHKTGAGPERKGGGGNEKGPGTPKKRAGVILSLAPRVPKCRFPTPTRAKMARPRTTDRRNAAQLGTGLGARFTTPVQPSGQ